MHPIHRLAVAPLLLLATLLSSPVPAPAAPLDLTLGFSSLPSAQGFSYTAAGAHAGVAESSVFGVSGGVLSQNTIGQYLGTSGAGLYYQYNGGITSTEVKELHVRARCLQVAGSSVYPLGQGGFLFAFATGATQYAFALSDTRIFVLQGASYVTAAGTYDNTQFHDYVFTYTPPSTTTLMRDGVVVGTWTGGGALAASRVLVGDGTGGANARGEISAFRFLQDPVTPAGTSSWGRLKSLYR